MAGRREKQPRDLILADTSAWVEFLRATGSRTATAIRDRVGTHALATTEPVAMEVLSGAADQPGVARLRSLLASCTLLEVGGLSDYEAAAEIYRACRRGGAAPRNQIDCLIAAVAIRNSVSILHSDADFDRISRHTPLTVHKLA